MKVLGTETKLYGKMLEDAKEIAGSDFGFHTSRNQFRIICGCKGMADANRQCEAAGLDNRTFHKAYTSESFNDGELEVAGNGGVFVKCGSRYVAVGTLNKD